MSDWNQPICFRCWDKRHPGGRVPVRMTPPEAEVCSYCGLRTISGIYLRDDPKNVPFPVNVRLVNGG